MGKVDTRIDSKLFKSSSNASATAAPTQRLIEVIEEEEEIHIAFRAPISFKDKLDRYFADHKPELRAKGCKTLKGFIQMVLNREMDTNP
jgi:hypothetical protein